MRNGYLDDDAIRQQLMAALNRGMSREEMADWLGISRPFLSQFLNRSRPHASAAMLKRLKLEETRYYRRVG